MDEGIRELRGKGEEGEREEGKGRGLEVVRSWCVGVRDKGVEGSAESKGWRVGDGLGVRMKGDCLGRSEGGEGLGQDWAG